MEKILITYSREGRDTAGKVQEAIKKAGFRSTLGAVFLDENGETPEVVVAVITDDSTNDPGMADILRQCSEKNINVVPYVAVNLPKNILTDFFLDEHVWIDGASQNQGAALGDLTDLLKRNFKELAKPATKKKSDFGKKPTATTAPAAKKGGQPAPPSEKEKLYKNLLFVSAAVIAVMLFILIGGGIKQENREASNQQANFQNAQGKSNIKIELSTDLKKSETVLVGEWRMTEYIDNQFRPTHEDSVNIQQLIDALVGRAQLIFNSDKTFTRIGFQEQPENGTWEYDPQSKYLKLKPTDVNQYDIVQIQELSSSKLIIAVPETVDNKQVITKVVFSKVR